MRQTKVKAGLLITSCLSILTLAAAPVWAEGSGHGTGLEVSSNTSTTGSTTLTQTSNDEHQGGSGAVEAQAATLLQNERKDNKSKHSEAEKHNACQARQASIDKRTDNYAKAAQRHLDVFNNIFSKVQKFYTDKKLNVANYDTLVLAAQAKQTAAQQAVDTLKALNVKLDCTALDPASAVATLKTATANARQALKDYRSAIKDVMVALKGASTAQTQNSTEVKQ